MRYTIRITNSETGATTERYRSATPGILAGPAREYAREVQERGLPFVVRVVQV